VAGPCLDNATLLAFLYGDLPAASRSEVEAHLGGCPSCTELTTWAAADLPSRMRETGERQLSLVGELAVGSQVGRYRILALIGRGGMGEVYAAYHPDLERRIALKIVDESGPDSAERRARLLREARAIARLSHPNVVTVYDAGTIGVRVYIAMELVEGETVAAWLRAVPRTWRDVVDVFIAAGRGLAAAHAAEIVHRDFKPHNVMIGKDGAVRVMDFGLARLVNEHAPADSPRDGVEPDADQGSVTVTKTGALLGTPAYMAPEQFRGEPTDARSDQFSYCVALHEALYGFRPRLAHLDNDRGPGGVPSVPPAEGRRRVPAWLRSAVLRGLRHDRQERFSSINELLAILDRGRARVRRRMIGAAASLAVALAVVAGWRVSHPQRYECRPAPSRLADAWSAEGGTGSRRDRLNQALLASGRADAAAVWRRLSAALDGHVARWTAMYQETCEATHVRGEQSAEVLDLRMRCLANNLDEVRALTDVLTSAKGATVGQAVSAAGTLTPVAVCADVTALQATVPFPKDEKSRRTVEGLQRRLNDVRALREVGHPHDAMDQARALRSLIEQAGYAPLTASLLMNTGMNQSDIGDFVESQATLKAAFVTAEIGNDASARAEAAISLVFALSQLGRFDECDLWLREANAILDRLGPGHERTRAWALNNEAAILADTGDLERARQAFEKAIALKEQSAGPTHPDVAMSLLGLGDVLKDLGNLEAALAAEDRALAIWNENGSSFAAKAESNKAEILLALARPAEAEVSFERALRALEREGGPDNIFLAYPLNGLGETRLVQGDPEAAVRWFERALRLRQDDKKQNNPLLVAQTQFGLARALWDANRDRPRALSLARSARAGYGDGHHGDALAKVNSWLVARTPRRSSP
jgi:eukaryotic-like serine/threonine-protein kinase